ncbi:MAG: gas vesicle protein GvpG [Methanotrichaceae archaeon]|nr:gas vesicle protein GvpG [Methanotrichaceae archaeon]
MLIIDDVLLRMLGISLPVFDLLWTLEQIQNYAFRETYNPEKIRNRIKENRLLFEFGELSRDEYEQANIDLLHQLKMAERVGDMNLGMRTDLLGSI